MSIKSHVFYLGIIFLLGIGLVSQGRSYQQLSRSLSQDISPREAYSSIRNFPQTHQIIDLRGVEEYEEGHIPGALNLERGIVKQDFPLDRYKETIIVTEDGNQGVFKEMAQHLILATNLAGGMVAWRMARQPEESGGYELAQLAKGPAG